MEKQVWWCEPHTFQPMIFICKCTSAPSLPTCSMLYTFYKGNKYSCLASTPSGQIGSSAPALPSCSVQEEVWFEVSLSASLLLGNRTEIPTVMRELDVSGKHWSPGVVGTGGTRCPICQVMLTSFLTCCLQLEM